MLVEEFTVVRCVCKYLPSMVTLVIFAHVTESVNTTWQASFLSIFEASIPGTIQHRWPDCPEVGRPRKRAKIEKTSWCRTSANERLSKLIKVGCYLVFTKL